MANQITDNLHAQVHFDDAGNIIAQSGIQSVVRNGVGDYTVTLLEGIADSESVEALCVPTDFSSEAAEPATGCVVFVDAVTRDVFTFEEGYTAADLAANLNLYRVSNSDGD